MASQSGGKTAQKINTSQGGSNLFLVFWGLLCVFVSVFFLSETQKKYKREEGWGRRKRMC